MAVDTVAVFASGPPPSASALAAVPAGATVVAADGADHARTAGLQPALVVGDLDSISPAALAAAEDAGVRVERHPTAKDQTDLELALDAALALAPRRVVVVGGQGGRFDHLVGELLLLGSPRYAGVELDAFLDDAVVHVVRGERSLTGEPGELVSLFAVHGPAQGVLTHGLLYPLRGETLQPGSSRGVSNELVAAEARIVVAGGVLLAVRPGSGPAGTASS